MRKHGLTLALVVLLGLGSIISLQAENTKASPERIGHLIGQLGSKKFAERRQASKALDAIGLPALESLRRAMTSDDMETSRRARDLVARIEKRAEAAEALAPTRVHLVCKDMPVTAAVALLAKQSKFDIQVHPNAKAKLAKRKITLDTGKVTFWEAYDQLCQKGGLVESPWPNGGMHFPADGMQPRIEMQPPAPVLPPPQPPRAVPKIKPPRLKRIQKAAAPRKAKAAQKVQIGVVVKGVQVRAPAVVPIIPAPAARVFPIGPVNGYYGDPFQPQNNGAMVLADGKPETLPTRYCGALRIRLKAKTVHEKAASRLLAEVEVSAEPKLKAWSLLGSPKIEQATDDREQNLTLVLERRLSQEEMLVGMAGRGVFVTDLNMPIASSPSHRQSLHVRFKFGDKKAGRLKTFTGSLSAEVHTPPAALITVDKVLQAAGQTVKGAKGGSIKVIKAGKNDKGDYEIHFKLEKPAAATVAVNPWGAFGNVNRFGGVGGAVQIRVVINNGNVIQIAQVGGNLGLPANGNSLSLVDAKGNHFVLVGSSGKTDNESMEMTLTFRPGKGRFGVPEKFVYTASRKIMVDVPFAFKDVQLP